MLSSCSTRPSVLPRATVRRECVKSIATSTPGGRCRVTARARRPFEEVSRTDTTPMARRSRTIFDTLAADRPVARAISAWVSVPPLRSAAITRSRLACRRAARDPGVTWASVVTGAPCSGRGRGGEKLSAWELTRLEGKVFAQLTQKSRFCEPYWRNLRKYCPLRAAARSSEQPRVSAAGCGVLDGHRASQKNRRERGRGVG